MRRKQKRGDRDALNRLALYSCLFSVASEHLLELSSPFSLVSPFFPPLLRERQTGRRVQSS